MASQAFLLAFAVLALAGVGTNGYVASTGKPLPFGPWRKMPPPSRGWRIAYGGVAVVLLIWAVGLFAAFATTL